MKVKQLIVGKIKETRRSDGDALYHCKNGWGIEPHSVLPGKAQAQHCPLQKEKIYSIINH